VVLRGVPAVDGVGSLTEQLRDAVEGTLDRAIGEQIHDPDLLQQLVHDDLAKLVFKLTKRRPMIVPVIVEV
jgi:mRNA degradation ribonuclease J1/J2